MSLSTSFNSLRRRCLNSRLSDQRHLQRDGVLDGNFFAERKWSFGFHSRSLHILRGIKHSKLPRIPCLSLLSRRLSINSFCSNSASNVGFLKWYLRKLELHPFITKSVTTSLIYAAADLTSQMITMPPSGSFDLVRTSRMASYGLIILGPSQHLWFNFLSRALPKRDVKTTLKKIIMGQAIYGPCSNTIFFSYNAALQGENTDEIAARLKRDLLPTLRNGLVYWPLCDFVTFKFVPVHLQPLVNSSCAYLWTIYLTYVANLKKAS